MMSRCHFKFLMVNELSQDQGGLFFGQVSWSTYQDGVKGADEAAHEHEADKRQSGDGAEREARRVQHDAGGGNGGDDVRQRGQGAHQAGVVPNLQILK